MKRIKQFFRYDNAGWLYVFPAFAYMLYFVGYPILQNIVLSFQDVTMRTLTAPDKPFAGLANYIDIFKDRVFRTSLVNTLVFTVSCLVIQFLIGFALALFFNQNFKFAKPVRGLLMMPWMIPITVTALMFKFIFGTDVGILNYILSSLGLIKENIEWLTTPGTAMFALICANVWIGIPFNMILISTGLTTIPKELYESASIDGAGKGQTFFKITLPLLKPILIYVMITSLIGGLQMFDVPQILTNGQGDPMRSTMTLIMYLNKHLFSKNYGMAGALSVILFIVTGALSLVVFRFTNASEE